MYLFVRNFISVPFKSRDSLHSCRFSHPCPLFCYEKYDGRAGRIQTCTGYCVLQNLLKKAAHFILAAVSFFPPLPGINYKSRSGIPAIVALSRLSASNHYFRFRHCRPRISKELLRPPRFQLLAVHMQAAHSELDYVVEYHAHSMYVHVGV